MRRCILYIWPCCATISYTTGGPIKNEWETCFRCGFGVNVPSEVFKYCKRLFKKKKKTVFKTAEKQLCMSRPQSRIEGRPEAVANMMLEKYGELSNRGV